MCCYCMMGDFTFPHDPPWRPNDFPAWPQQIPAAPPLGPQYIPWDIDKLMRFHDILRRVKELEDKLGCPCEPNKADYLGLIEQRIAELEKRATPK